MSAGPFQQHLAYDKNVECRDFYFPVAPSHRAHITGSKEEEEEEDGRYYYVQL
jgi:hypothetical protein